MKLTIDSDNQTLSILSNSKTESMPLYSKKAFEIISNAWVKVGWNQKYTYTFSWMGRPIIQLPEDLIRVQEVVYKLKPDILLCAHLHESEGIEEILGKTLVINVGRKGKIIEI